MSNPRTKAEQSKAKDARQMPVEDPGKHPSKRKRTKPFTVEARRLPGTRHPNFSHIPNEWGVWGRYHSREVAQTAMELAGTKYSFYEFRVTEEEGVGDERG